MPKQFRNHRYEIGILTMFFAFFVTQLVILASGFAWVQLDPDWFSFWMLVFVTMLVIVSGVVATYSFVQYTQERSLRSFVITFLGANVILLSFFYLLTNPATTWSIFSSRQRNITIVAALGCLITPGVLGGSLVGRKTVTPRYRNITLLWGAVLQPLVSFLLLLSPKPVFTLTGAGLANLSLAGWILSIIIGVSTFLSLIRYLQEWFRTRESITLASSLALVLWITSFFIYLAIASPTQVAELLWFSGVAEGFVLLAVTMIITSIIEPHRVLESLVEERTVQLNESRKETEFYLRLWTHKIGNLLQGISTYLELIGNGSEEIPTLSDSQKIAMDLVNESTLVNRQIDRLVRIKEKEVSVIWPINVSQILSKLEEKTPGTHNHVIFIERTGHIDHEVQILADDLIDIVFSNLLAKCAKEHKENEKKPTIRILENKNTIQVIFSPCSLESVSEVNEWSMHKPSSKNSVVDLDLFMVWQLMDKYGGGIEHRKNPDSLEEELVLTFQKAEKSMFGRFLEKSVY